ncbi:MAG TPA: hypothetical protein DD435_13315 [Cyanobacteria bacterium UBA8530]|nr:hypothetical protein [Cyanobacteria bacterium UBA8530]
MISTATGCAVLDRVAVRNAVISLYDKVGLDAFVRSLSTLANPLVCFSTGGTLQELQRLFARLDEGNPLFLRSIEEHTGYPEMPGGLVKTLHPRIHGGLLSESGDEAQEAHLREQGMCPFDLLAVNLYPFERTVARSGATLEEARRQVDIGGVAMLRAGAKNFLRVAVLCDPNDYPLVARELLENDGTIGFSTRWRLAQKAFRYVQDYDRAISDHFASIPLEVARSQYHVR